ncbi:hypothetical protein GCM10009789_28440 [Kribbella sancticallisti]|uniref:Uncharacterized protein n=1 Tax=Kribbella sancticallisti TaxID=460087 RepID=A0ABP4P629_9ACTN
MQLRGNHYFVLETACAGVLERAAPAPCGWSDVSPRDGEAGLFTEFSDRSIEVCLARVDPTTGQLPAHALLRMHRLVNPQQQNPAIGVENYDTHSTTLDQGQVTWNLHQTASRQPGVFIFNFTI